MYRYNIAFIKMSNADYSRMLTKMAELKELEAEYKRIVGTYRPATSTTEKGTYNQIDNKNAMSNTATPLVTRPGDDHVKVWKYVGKIDLRIKFKPWSTRMEQSLLRFDV